MKNNDLRIEKRELHNFNTSDNKLRNFGFLEIPAYQRDYEWGTDNVQNLLADIIDKAKEYKAALYKSIDNLSSNSYKSVLRDELKSDIGVQSSYFGNVVITLSGEPGKRDGIVDGQQRLTTLFLILKWISWNRDSLIVNEKFESAKQALINKLDSTITYLNEDGEKVPNIETKNRRDNSYLSVISSSESANFIFDSSNGNKRIFASKYLKNLRLIDEYFNKIIESDGPEFLFFILWSTLSIELGVTSVQNEARAFDLFEALNSKGLALNQSDLIKNKFFKVLSTDPEYDVEDEWNKFIENLSGKDDSNRVFSDATAFIRAFLIAKTGKYIKKKELFAKISDSIKDRANSKTLLTNISNVALQLSKLITGDSKSDFSLKEKDEISRAMNEMPKIYLPLIVYLIQLENDELLYKSVMWLEKQSFIHFTINDIASKEIDANVHKVIATIEARKKDGENVTWDFVKSIFNSEIFSITLKGAASFDDLVKQIARFDFTSRKKILQLYKIIFNYRNAAKDETYEQLSESIIDLEHLMPQSKALWVANGLISETQHAEFVKKLGNLFFVKGSINKSVSNAIYSDKLNNAYYSDESSKNNKTLMDSSLFISDMKFSFGEVPAEWNAEKIQERTNKIIDYIISEKILDPR